MARVFATGTLSSSNLSDDISCEGKYTTAFGLKVSGTFGTGVFRTRPGILESGHSHVFFDPADGSKSSWSTNVAGLFYLPGIFEHIRLVVGTPDGTTDLDYVIYLPARP